MRTFDEYRQKVAGGFFRKLLRRLETCKVKGADRVSLLVAGSGKPMTGDDTGQPKMLCCVAAESSLRRPYRLAFSAPIPSGQSRPNGRPPPSSVDVSVGLQLPAHHLRTAWPTDQPFYHCASRHSATGLSYCRRPDGR